MASGFQVERGMAVKRALKCTHFFVTQTDYIGFTEAFCSGCFEVFGGGF